MSKTYCSLVFPKMCLVIFLVYVYVPGVIITADQRSVARNELTTDRTKFILSDQFDRMIFMFDLQLSFHKKGYFGLIGQLLILIGRK